MESKNVVNGIICSMAKVEKETDKAYQLTFVADIYGKSFVIKKQWMPKSLIEVKKIDGDTVWFTAKNNWIIGKKCKDYCKYVADMFTNISSEIKTYLSRTNNLVVEQVLI